MKTKKEILSLILICALCALNLSAQTKNPKFGKTAKDHLEMTVYAQDSSADAVKLFDEGKIEVRLNEGVEMFFTRHYQIKLLRESAKSWADVSIVYWHEDKVSDIKAQTILPNGKTVKVKGGDIFTEESKKNYKVKKFTMPQVAAGAVLEVKYRQKSRYIFALEPWVFQDAIPTIHSRLTLFLDPGFIYNGKIANDTKRRVKETTEQFHDLHNNNALLKKFIFSGEHFPAVKREPFISSLKNYRARLDFQISGFRRSYTKLTFVKDFKTLCKELLDSDYGTYMQPSGETRKVAASLIAGKSSGLEKTEAVFKFVRDGLENEVYANGLSPRKKQGAVLKDKKASPSERNLLMVAMLRSAGIQADPLLISTRGHGWADPGFPFLSQFNRTLALVEIDRRKYVLDASDKFTPFGKLPPESLVEVGMHVTDDTASFVKTPIRGVKSKELVESFIRVDNSGGISGKTQWMAAGYAGRMRHIQFDQRNYLGNVITEDFAKGLENFSIDSVGTVETTVDSDSFKTLFKFSLENYAEKIENEIFLRPSIFFTSKQNAFVSRKRDFPVEFGYLSQRTEVNTFILSEECDIPELPKPVLIRNAYITYRRTVSPNSNFPNALICTRYFKINKALVPPEDYEQLRQAFAQIVDADQEQLVISLQKRSGE